MNIGTVSSSSEEARESAAEKNGGSRTSPTTRDPHDADQTGPSGRTGSVRQG